ncbi:Ig-like domain-containing protein [Spirosoma pollinicola]|nr:Ig-like domain-containing protein [Spirosoma pollinicola]
MKQDYYYYHTRKNPIQGLSSLELANQRPVPIWLDNEEFLQGNKANRRFMKLLSTRPGRWLDYVRFNGSSLAFKSIAMLFMGLLALGQMSYAQTCNIVTNGTFAGGTSTGWTSSGGWQFQTSPAVRAFNNTDGAVNQDLSQTLTGLNGGPVAHQVTVSFDLILQQAGQDATAITQASLQVLLNGVVYATFNNPTATGAATGKVTVTMANGASISGFDNLQFPGGTTGNSVTDAGIAIVIPWPAGSPNNAALTFRFNSPYSNSSGGTVASGTGNGQGGDDFGLENVGSTGNAASAPTLSSGSIAISCPAATANINSLLTSTATGILWYTNNAHTGTAYATPTAAVAGTYYGFYNTSGCYTPASVAVSVTGVCITCTAGTTAPILSASTKANTCPATTVDLSTLTASNTPANTALAWFTAPTATSANAVSNPASVAAGTYYAAFYDSVSKCYSPTTAVTATLKNCLDSDNDGIPDVDDLDDDNDGIPDTIESGIACVGGDGNVNYKSWTLAELASGNAFFTSTTLHRNSPTGTLKYGDFPDFTASAATTSGTIPVVFGQTPWVDVPNGGADPNDGNFTQIEGFISLPCYSTSLKIRTLASGSPASVGTVRETFTTLHLALDASGNPTFNTTDLKEVSYQKVDFNGNIVNSTEYTFANTTSSGQWVRFGDAISDGADYYGAIIQWNVDGTGWVNVPASAFSSTSTGLIAGCASLDSDGDGIVNSLDTDSDNDGCSDAYEAGATTSKIANFQFPAASVGTNGLTNLKETVADNGILNYTPTYTQLALASFLNACADSDGDGISDLADLDDDNDGILDAVEAPDCYYTATEANTIQAISSIYPAPEPFQELYDGLATKLFNFTGSTMVVGDAIFTIVYPTAVKLTSISVSDNITTITATRARLDGSKDGVTWLELTSADVNLSTSPVVFTANSNIGEYQYYRIRNTIGGNLTTGNTIGEITSVLDASYIPSLHPKSVCTADTDGDGIFNSLDLDSDGDGCPDAIEGGAAFKIGNITPVGALTGTVSSATATYGVPTQAGAGQTIGSSQNAAVKDIDCTVPPTLMITGPANLTTTNTNPPVSGTATPGASVTVNGQNGQKCVTTADAITGAWTCSSLTFTVGSQTVTAVASNTAGVSNTAAASFTVVGCAFPAVGGTATYAGGAICPTNNAGTITLTGQTGGVVKWQTSTDGGTTWVDLPNSATNKYYTFYNAVNNQQYRAVLNTGGAGCPDAYSNPATITTSAGACTSPTCDKTAGTIVFGATPAVSGSNYTNMMVLINASGLIQYISAPGSPSLTGVAAGDYFVYQITYDNTVTPLPTISTGINLSAIGGACVALSNQLAVKVCPASLPPVVKPDIATTNINTPVSGNVLTNDTDPNAGGSLTASLLGQPTSGTVTMNPNGSYTYTPPTGFTGVASFCYSVTNTAGLSSSACAAITVVPGPSLIYNNAPIANNDNSQVTSGQSVTINVAANDTDPDSATSLNGQLNTPTLGSPSVGTASLNPDGTVKYTAPANFTGVVTLPYTICDKGTPPLCSSAIITINVQPTPPVGTTLSPIAGDDALITTINTPKTGTVAANDSDPNSPALPLTYTTGQPASGTVIMTPTGSYTYTPAPGFVGPASFTYNVCNSAGKCAAATVNVDVLVPVALPPVATPDIANTNPDTPVSGNVLTNDSDPQNQPLVATLLSQPTSGTVVLNPNGTYTYTPPSGFTGVASFCYSVSNTAGLSSSACVTVNVNPVPSPNPAVDNAPIANNDNTQTTAGTSVTINVAANDTDPDSATTLNGQLSAPTIVSQPSVGVASVVNGKVVYTPPANFTGVVSFPYSICDKATPALCATAVVTVNVQPTPPVGTTLSPVAVDDALLTTKNTSATGTVAANDSDPNSPALPLTFTSGQPAHGTVVMGPNGTYAYIPATGYTGPDSFTYTACNTAGKCDVATVSVSVQPSTVTNPPVIIGQPIVTDQGNPITVCLPIIDADHLDSHTASICAQPGSGTATVVVNNTANTACVTYTPATTFTGATTVCIQVCDSQGNCVQTIIPITVIPTSQTIALPQPPVVVVVPIVTPKDSTAQVCMTIVDPNMGDVQSVTLCSSPTKGSVTATVNNTTNQVCVLYKPTPGSVGPDAVCLLVCDQSGLCTQVTVPVTIVDPTPPGTTPVAPVVTPTPIVVTAGQAITVCTAITDNVGDTHTATLCGQPASGVAQVGVNNVTHALCVTYTPGSTAPLNTTVCIQVCDQGGLCTTVILPITVLPAPKALLLPHVWLQGALFGVTSPTGLMRDDLRVKKYLPASSPYSSWTSITTVGPVSNTATVFGVTGNDAIVDWVFVELRSPSNFSLVVDSRPALVQRDGDIVEIDGTSAVAFSAVQGSYYVSVKHRNHLGVMTASAVPLSVTGTSVDFRTSATGTYRVTTSAINQSQVTVAQGVALWGGNVVYDKSVIYQGTTNDVSAIANQVKGPLNIAGNPSYILSGYYTGDVNLDGRTIYQGTGNDVNYIYLNVTKNHPGNAAGQNFFVIREQLP